MLSLALEEELKVLDFCLIAKLIILSCLTVFLFSLHFFSHFSDFQRRSGRLKFFCKQEAGRGQVGRGGGVWEGPIGSPLGYAVR